LCSFKEEIWEREGERELGEKKEEERERRRREKGGGEFRCQWYE